MLVLWNTMKVRAKLPILKFAPSWESLYVIHEDVGKGCYDLTVVDGDQAFLVNAQFWSSLLLGVMSIFYDDN